MQSRLSPTQPKPFLIALAMACVYLFWGGTYLGMKIAIETMPPFLMAGVRFLIAGSALYIVRRLMGDARPALRQWRDAGIGGGYCSSAATASSPGRSRRCPRPSRR